MTRSSKFIVPYCCNTGHWEG